MVHLQTLQHTTYQCQLPCHPSDPHHRLHPTRQVPEAAPPRVGATPGSLREIPS
jgi:hypothetical protein